MGDDAGTGCDGVKIVRNGPTLGGGERSKPDCWNGEWRILGGEWCRNPGDENVLIS